MSNKNKNLNTSIRQELIEKHICKYKGFIIKSCLSDFEDIYFTIINPKTNGHVHASSLNTAIKICDIARHIIYNPYIIPFQGRRLDLYERACKLAFRELNDERSRLNGHSI